MYLFRYKLKKEKSFKKYLLIYCLAALGPHCCVQAFSICSKWGLHSSCGGFSCCRVWSQQLQCMGLVALRHVYLSGPGIEPQSPALAGRFLSTVPPGKSQIIFQY